MKENNKPKILVYFVPGKEVRSAHSCDIEGFGRRRMAQNRPEAGLLFFLDALCINMLFMIQ